jgi:hypothetical protein
VERLLRLKRLRKAKDDDWMFPNRIRTAGKKMKPGPIWYEDLLGRVIQPAAKELGLPYVTWRLLRHLGSDRGGRGKGADQSCAGTIRSLSSRYSSQVLRSRPRRFYVAALSAAVVVHKR